MKSSDLTREQLDQLLERALADLAHYAKLRERMRQQGFPGDDPLCLAVDRAHAELQALRMWLHYAVCQRKRQADGWTG